MGWFPVRFTEESLHHPYFKTFQASPDVLHWHGDTFTIPDGAVVLASSEACKNQAFLYGTNIVAFQFHPEVTEKIFQNFLIHAKEDLQLTGTYIQNEETMHAKMPDLSEIRRQFTAFLNAFSLSR
ncbi:type 1 glutamine amidotransferase [Weizmannia acidilactici]|uniref:type 1 glutamine amidotransferase n=1 Tax=Weizmannia acidilactici TaxID=2607726 RepID=UPI0021754D9E|nr:hypothetical protein [Weizmannia acidilactici]